MSFFLSSSSSPPPPCPPFSFKCKPNVTVSQTDCSGTDDFHDKQEWWVLLSWVHRVILQQLTVRGMRPENLKTWCFVSTSVQNQDNSCFSKAMYLVTIPGRQNLQPCDSSGWKLLLFAGSQEKRHSQRHLSHIGHQGLESQRQRACLKLFEYVPCRLMGAD